MTLVVYVTNLIVLRLTQVLLNIKSIKLVELTSTLHSFGLINLAEKLSVEERVEVERRGGEVM